MASLSHDFNAELRQYHIRRDVAQDATAKLAEGVGSSVASLAKRYPPVVNAASAPAAKAAMQGFVARASVPRSIHRPSGQKSCPADVFS